MAQRFLLTSASVTLILCLLEGRVLVRIVDFTYLKGAQVELRGFWIHGVLFNDSQILVSGSF